MTDWREVLRNDRTDGMSPDRAQAIRLVVVETARNVERRFVTWPLRFVLASAAAVILLGGSGDRSQPLDLPPGTAADPAPSGERRQLQFATPGGTRIIWELNPEFSLMETLP